MVRENGKELELLSDELRNDREVVLAAVRQSGSVLEYWYASEALKGDREVVLVVAQSNWMALQHASAKVRSESEVVQVAKPNLLATLREDSDEAFSSLEYAVEEF